MEHLTGHDSVAQVDEHYRTSLQQYLDTREEVALLGAYELGRRALGDGLGVLQMATIHARATAQIVPAEVTDAETFFVEALSPFEMAHRAFRDANTTLRRLNEVLEGQAKRIASALHNEAGQLLASMHFALADASRDLPEEKAARVAQVRNMLLEMEERLRNLSHELRPPVLDDLGLAAALTLLGDTINKRWGLQVVLAVTLDRALPAAIENTIYRIAQEALTNAAKHADADVVTLRLRRHNGKVLFAVKDDGVGFENTEGFRKRRPGLGLTEIRERVAALGGAVLLRPNGERGTDLTIEIPLEP